jgi:hypothetical protein
MTEVGGQKTENNLPFVVCHLFSVRCPLYLPDTGNRLIPGTSFSPMCKTVPAPRRPASFSLCVTDTASQPFCAQGRTD